MPTATPAKYQRSAPGSLPGSDRAYLHNELGKIERVVASIPPVPLIGEPGAINTVLSSDGPTIAPTFKPTIDGVIVGGTTPAKGAFSEFMVGRTTAIAGSLATFEKSNAGGLGPGLLLNNSGGGSGDQEGVFFHSGGSARASIVSTVEGSPFHGDIAFSTGATSLTQRMRITGDGIVTVDHPGPTWAALATPYDVLRVAVNSFPTSGEFGSGSTALPQAIVGAIELPSSAVGGNHAAGVAGYVRTASTAQGAVGVFGAGTSNTASAAVFGGNFVASNTPRVNGGGNGFDLNNVYGVEIDMNVRALSGGTTPTGIANGILITGASNTAPTLFNALTISTPSVGEATPVNWKIGLNVEDNSSDIGLQLGTINSSNGSSASPIHFHGRGSAAQDRLGVISFDGTGNLGLQYGQDTNAAALTVKDASGTTALSVDTATVAVSGSLHVVGNIVQSSGLSATPAYDASAQTQVSVAGGAHTTIAPLFAGLLLITDNSTGDIALYLLSAAAGSVLISSSSGEFVAPTTTPAAGKSSVQYNGSTGFDVYNGRAATSAYAGIVFKLH